MGSQSALTDAQWRKIEKLLPETRRDRLMVEAVLFREFSGHSLTEVAWTFGITRVRLHTWSTALAADGTLSQLLEALKLEPNSGRGRVYYGNSAAQAAQISALRLGNFREALRGRR